MRQSLAPAPDRCLPAAACSDQEEADADRLGDGMCGGPHLWCLVWLGELACKTVLRRSSMLRLQTSLQDSVDQVSHGSVHTMLQQVACNRSSSSRKGQHELLSLL